MAAINRNKIFSESCCFGLAGAGVFDVLAVWFFIDSCIFLLEELR
jgi:hypothetical protein